MLFMRDGYPLFHTISTSKMGSISKFMNDKPQIYENGEFKNISFTEAQRKGITLRRIRIQPHDALGDVLIPDVFTLKEFRKLKTKVKN